MTRVYGLVKVWLPQVRFSPYGYVFNDLLEILSLFDSMGNGNIDPVYKVARFLSIFPAYMRNSPLGAALLIVDDRPPT